MDLHHVVRRVSDALGPSATPEQIERAAAVVLEEGRVAAPAPVHLLVVAAGPASAGLLPDLLSALARLGATPSDVVQRTGQAGTLLALDLAADAVAGGARALEADLHDVAARHAATLAVYHADVAAALLDA